MTNLWYSPSSIHRYTREELAWILREVWGKGWPEQETGYFDAHLNVDNGSIAGDLLDAASSVIWEVEERMKRSRCPMACRVLIYETQTEYFQQADLWHYDRFKDRLSPDARRMLDYLSGTWRRRMTFAKWCEQQDAQRKAVSQYREIMQASFTIKQ